MSVVRKVENTKTDSSDRPIQPVKIASCGVLAEDEDDGVPVPVGVDSIPDFPEVTYHHCFFPYFS